MTGKRSCRESVPQSSNSNSNEAVQMGLISYSWNTKGMEIYPCIRGMAGPNCKGQLGGTKEYISSEHMPWR